jgi:hypothetical protein
MTDIEDRLRDAFAAVDRQATPPPLPAVTTGRRATRTMLLAAAAALLALGAVSLSLFVDTGPDDVGVAANDVAPAAFDREIVTFCRSIQQHRPAPRFATVDAYRVVAEQALDLATTSRAALAGMRPPSDDPLLLGRVDADLAGVADRAQNVLDVVDLDRVDALPSAWAAVDYYFDIALGALADHGAADCAP